MEVYWELHVGREVGKQDVDAAVFLQKTVSLKSMQFSGTALNKVFSITAKFLRRVQIC